MERAEKERRWRKETGEMEREFEGRVAGLAQENEKNKIVMRQKL
jgi:hypothetical protein